MTVYGSDFSRRRNRNASTEKIVDALLINMALRIGFDDVWGQMDEPAQAAMRADWIALVSEMLSTKG
jgi:hypothetical protein